LRNIEVNVLVSIDSRAPQEFSICFYPVFLIEHFAVLISTLLLTVSLEKTETPSSMPATTLGQLGHHVPWPAKLSTKVWCKCAIAHASLLKMLCYHKDAPLPWKPVHVEYQSAQVRRNVLIMGRDIRPLPSYLNCAAGGKEFDLHENEPAGETHSTHELFRTKTRFTSLLPLVSEDRFGGDSGAIVQAVQTAIANNSLSPKIKPRCF